MAKRQKILIIDNDETIAEEISLYLTKECGYETKIISDGYTAMKKYFAFRPDLIILELTLPGMDGYQLCRHIHDGSRIPVIILSSRMETKDRVMGLEMGADDFVGKPFDMKELSARIKAVLRRTDPESFRQDETETASAAKKIVSFQDLTVNLRNYSVICRGKAVEMPPKEIELLFFLASSPNQVFTRDQLLNQIWGYDYVGDTRTVDVHIMRLRDKLGSTDHWSINTVWGVGYKFSLHN